MKAIVQKYFRAPRSMFVRALLMIMLPVMLLQLLVGGLIVQRHFDETTAQLTRHAIDELRFAEANSQNKAEFLDILRNFDIRPTDRTLSDNQFAHFDLSGRFILSNFRTLYQENALVDSRKPDDVFVQIAYQDEKILLNFPRQRLTAFNPQQIMLNTFGFSLILLLISVIFLRNQVRSIRRLAQASEAFGRGETLYYEPRGPSEIRAAGRSFLSMRARIERQREQRGLMLSGISHDLRTPLTRMRLSLELSDHPEREALLNDVREIELLTNSFLEYASNDVQDQAEEIDVSDQLTALCSAHENAEFVGAFGVHATVRPLLFERAINNLLNNAARFANRIEVSATINKQSLTIRVDDDGPGIAVGAREEALKPFTRLDHARAPDDGAHAGLGLAIVADIARLHGGSFLLEDSPLGGLAAILILPQPKSKR